MTQIDPTLHDLALNAPTLEERQAALDAIVAASAPTPPPAAPPVAPVEPPAPVGPSAEAKELAFAKAGLPITDQLVATIARAYEGELTDEAILAHAAALRLPGTQAPPVDPASAAAGGQAGERQLLAGGEFVPPVTPTKSAQERMAEACQAARDEGFDEDTILQVGFQELMQRAMEGDTSVTVDERNGQRMERWRELGKVSNSS